MQRICTSLSTAGYEVILVGRKLPNSKPFQGFPFQQKRIKNIFNKGKFFYLEYNIRLFFFLLFSKFDVICSIDLDTLLAGYMAGSIKRTTIVYDAHEYFTEVPEIVERPATKKIWETLANFLIPKIKHAYTVGQGLAAIFKEKYGVAFQVIRNVPMSSSEVDKNKQKDFLNEYNLSLNKDVLLYQGALNDGRGISEMIAAMVHLKNAELWLAGEGDLSSELRQLTRKLNVEERVKFLGYLLPNELKLLTPLATIGLNLLENKGLNYYYSLANKCFDYIQAQVPAIHMDFPEYQAINQEYEVGILIPDLATATIVKAVNTILKDDVLKKRLIHNCKQAKNVYTWENEEKKLLSFYKKIEKN